MRMIGDCSKNKHKPSISSRDFFLANTITMLLLTYLTVLILCTLSTDAVLTDEYIPYYKPFVSTYRIQQVKPTDSYKRNIEKLTQNRETLEESTINADIPLSTFADIYQHVDPEIPNPELLPQVSTSHSTTQKSHQMNKSRRTAFADLPNQPLVRKESIPRSHPINHILSSHKSSQKDLLIAANSIKLIPKEIRAPVRLRKVMPKNIEQLEMLKLKERIERIKFLEIEDEFIEEVERKRALRNLQREKDEEYFRSEDLVGTHEP